MTPPLCEAASGRNPTGISAISSIIIKNLSLLIIPLRFSAFSEKPHFSTVVRAEAKKRKRSGCLFNALIRSINYKTINDERSSAAQPIHFDGQAL